MHPDMGNRDKARLEEIIRHKKLFRDRAKKFQKERQFKASIDNQIKSVELDRERATIYLNFYAVHNPARKSYWKNRIKLFQDQKNHLITVRRQLDGQPGTPHTPLDPDSISSTSNAEIIRRVKASPQQDTAHNLILNKLLVEKYQATNIDSDLNSPHYNPNHLGYDVVRNGQLQHPLFRIRDMNGLQAIHSQLPFAGNNEKNRFPHISNKINNKKMANSIFIRDFMHIASAGNMTVEDWLIEDLALRSDFAHDFNTIVDQINGHIPQLDISKFSGIAHRDAMQIIPNSVAIPGNTTVRADQFVGAMMSNTRVENNVISSEGHLQGIFASDGAFKNLVIKNNNLNIAGAHSITINGLLSGDVSGNKDLNDNALADDKIHLLPLRIGGGTNIYIIGFVNSHGAPAAEHYEYEPISNLGNIQDLRQSTEGVNNRGTFYDQVNMAELHKEYAALNKTIRRTAQGYHQLMWNLVQKGQARLVKEPA
ncbi:MAG: Unknown protein [uncultured Thiotrichaceae bacterium]|uniref:Uncharacterized protein n=1 Tax=uncultured Thiotrichaceae bacterium TaxID=298394 RepID=A0A6S6S956_9GAMM|nr:MAG: Unknown protein [uncultured Thiotrichaceae bacterium]